MLELLLFVLPLGVDTFGISLGLGIKSSPTQRGQAGPLLPLWLRSALLFSLAEAMMPLLGLGIGYVASLIISSFMHYVGSLLLIGIGGWEIIEEMRERLGKRREPKGELSQTAPAGQDRQAELKEGRFDWRRQLLLALSVSLDELAVGFSLGSITAGKHLSPLVLCVFIGLQGFLLTLLGLTLGRILRTRLKPVKEWSELLSGLLLIMLGIWLLIT